MMVLLLDTNIVSILFKPDHTLYAQCASLAAGNQLFISFMTRAELALWPKQNHWGPKRRGITKARGVVYNAVRR
jgi:predicted nucleic acid-binding protein